MPVLGLIFLRYADERFTDAKEKLEAEAEGASRRRRGISKIDYQARGVMYLPEEARFSNLMQLPEGSDIGKAVNDAMRAIEEIGAQDWSLNPGRYVGAAEREEEDFDFVERLTELNEELEVLNAEARELEERIATNVAMVLEGAGVYEY